MARTIGCDIALWRPKEEDTWHFDPADLEALLRPDTKLVVCNFPHNPTGALPSHADFVGVIAATARTGAWLFSDGCTANCWSQTPRSASRPPIDPVRARGIARRVEYSVVWT